jgi:hypothetical protein
LFFFKKYFPLLLSIVIFIFFERLNFFLKKNLKFYYFFKYKAYFDFFFNYFLIIFKKSSITIFFKFLDKGILDIIGPHGILRQCFLMVSFIKELNISLIFNYFCLLLFFLSFLLILF